jgi:hypothetical protein
LKIRDAEARAGEAATRQRADIISTLGCFDAIEISSSASGVAQTPNPELFRKEFHSIAQRSFPASCNQNTQLN